MKIATWNVNGIRARAGQVEQWLDAERPDVLCLQEIKASPEQVPLTLAGRDDYWSCWHGSGGYSGVALLVHRDLAGADCRAAHPAFDFEYRVASITQADLEILSVYVPNGGKDFAAKMQFLEALGNYVAETQRDGRRVVVCGDLNVALTDLDLHPKERKANAIGQRPDERALLQRLIGLGLTDVHRALHPDDEGLFTWWAPWRNLRQRNIGWRIDYVLATASLGATATRAECQREFGTSDHAPLVVELG
jgi:exodeoxyribonuclease III